MDNLLKRTRARFSGSGKESKKELDRGKDQNIPTQKTQSFKEKRKGQSWFPRLISRKMSRDYDSSGTIDQATAVAAAAFAIHSLKESGIADQKKKAEEPETSVIKIRSKQEDKSVPIPETGRVSKRFSGSKEIIEDKDSKVPIITAPDRKKYENNILHTPPIKKTPTISDKQSSKEGSIKPAETLTAKPNLPPSAVKPPHAPDLPSAVKPLPFPAKTKRHNLSRPGMAKSNADIWEETEIEKIEKRHEEQNTTINTWEDKKKRKARRKLEKIESELDRKRTRAWEKYRSNMKYIDQVAGGARAKAEEWKRNETLKATEKANVIRKTGKAPTTCCCF